MNVRRATLGKLMGFFLMEIQFCLESEQEAFVCYILIFIGRVRAEMDGCIRGGSGLGYGRMQKLIWDEPKRIACRGIGERLALGSVGTV